MGIKLRESVNTIPASIKDGKLLYHIGSKEYSIEVTEIKTLVFEEQCNHFRCRNMMVYLIGEVYSIVMRYDGTGTVFTTSGAILCKTFKFDIPDFATFYVTRGGAVKQKRHARYDMVELFTNGHDYVLSVVNAPISLTFQKDENLVYLQELATYRTECYPEMRIMENNLFVVNTGGSVMYKIIGQLSVGQGITML